MNWNLEFSFHFIAVMMLSLITIDCWTFVKFFMELLLNSSMNLFSSSVKDSFSLISADNISVFCWMNKSLSIFPVWKSLQVNSLKIDHCFWVSCLCITPNLSRRWLGSALMKSFNISGVWKACEIAACLRADHVFKVSYLA